VSVVRQCELLGLPRSSYYYEPAQVSAEALRKVAGEFDRPIATLEVALRNLEARLDEAGQPWGQDKAGRAVSGSYLPARDDTVQVVRGLVENLVGKRSDLMRMALSYEQADEANSL